MAERKPAAKSKKKSATTAKASQTFSDDERAAMKERAKSSRQRSVVAVRSKADGEQDVLAKIAELPEPDRTMATRLHAVIKASAPALESRTWYGMPAYALNGKVVCFVQSAQKFKTRYVDPRVQRYSEARRWRDVADRFAVTKLTPAEEKKIAALVKKAVG